MAESTAHETHASRDHRWLAATLPFVRAHLPPPPARVLELGCGSLGGFVAALRLEGYVATGIDPQAPDGAEFSQTEFEQYDVTQRVDAIVACTSLHHVAELDLVLDRVGQALVPGGTVVVVEWAHELFDEPTAQWCFARLRDVDDDDPGWLHRHRYEWAGSGQTWDSYRRTAYGNEPMHPGDRIVAALLARFERMLVTRGPYFFPALDYTTRADEQAAIDAGLIQATGIGFVGRLG